MIISGDTAAASCSGAAGQLDIVARVGREVLLAGGQITDPQLTMGRDIGHRRRLLGDQQRAGDRPVSAGVDLQAICVSAGVDA